MFKIVSKEKFLKMEEAIRKKDLEISSLEADVAFFEEKNESLNYQIDELLAKLKKYEEAEEQSAKTESIISDENSVTMLISDDLDRITPIVKYKNTVAEALFQAGMIDDTKADNPFAIQLALITVANEAMAQLIESFEENIVQED